MDIKKTVLKAIEEKKNLKIIYSRSSDIVGERLVTPIKDRINGFEGYCHTREGYRKFMYDYIDNIEIVDSEESSKDALIKALRLMKPVNVVFNDKSFEIHLRGEKFDEIAILKIANPESVTIQNFISESKEYKP